MFKPNDFNRRRKPRKSQEVAIMSLPSDTSVEVAYSMVQDDRVLINAICGYSKELRKNDGLVKIFERKSNVIRTSLGFFFAMYEEDKVLVEGGMFKPEDNEGGIK